MPGEAYYRCRHCRGFYEATLAACKWCNYDAPFLDTAGKRRVFADRESCRALQLAEYEQLPKEAHEDCMGPPPNELTLLCNCLHCGPDGHLFEAIEMRWIVNERMWACPCTTCGGRGFGMDVHSAENKWRCAECGHFYMPANNDYRHENAKCPQCGCEEASGWFDDGYDEEDFEEFQSELNEGERARGDRPAAEVDEDEPLPWEDDEESGPERERAYDLGISWKESDEEELIVGPERIPDDIDHPFERGERDSDFNDDDIPF